jgi:hypothetical protein
LQYFNTTIIIISTYIVGLMIGVITKSIDYNDPIVIVALVTFTLLFMSISAFILLHFKYKMREATFKIKRIK